MKFLFIYFFCDFTLLGKAVKANVQKIPVFFQKFHHFRFAFCRKNTIVVYNVLNYRCLPPRKCIIFIEILKKNFIFALVEMFVGANNYLLLQTQTDLNQDFTHSAWHL